jgi:hypothetical protein
MIPPAPTSSQQPGAEACSRPARATGDSDHASGASATERRKPGLRWSAVSGFLILLLAFFAATPARAGNLLDCVKAVAPLGDAAKVSALSSKVAFCTSQMSDGVEAVVVATIVALAADNVIPSNTEGCRNAIDSVILGQVAQALVNAGLASDLNEAMNMAGLDAIIGCACTIAGAPDEMKEIVADYMSTVDGCKDFLASIGETLSKWLNDVGCFFESLAGDCGEDQKKACDAFLLPMTDEEIYWNCLKYGATADAPCAQTCDEVGHGDRWCQDLVCDSGRQCAGPRMDRCDPCVWSDPHAIASTDLNVASCACAAPYTPVYDNHHGVNVLRECVCAPPSISQADGSCKCPTDQTLLNGVCTPCVGCDQKAVCDPGKGEYLDVNSKTCKTCASDQQVYYGFAGNPQPPGGLGGCTPCPSGQRQNPKDPTQCGVPACPPGQITTGFINPDTGAKGPDLCHACQPNTKAVYDNPGLSSIGKCDNCPAGTSSSAGSTTCPALVCGQTGWVDPNIDPYACQQCPGNQIYFPGRITPLQGGGQANVAGHCGCPSDRTQVGDTCQCPANSMPTYAGMNNLYGACCPSGAGVIDVNGAPTCQCPDNSKPDSTGQACACPSPRVLRDGKCVFPTTPRESTCPAGQVAFGAKDVVTVGPGGEQTIRHVEGRCACPDGSAPQDGKCVEKVITPPSYVRPAPVMVAPVAPVAPPRTYYRSPPPAPPAPHVSRPTVEIPRAPVARPPRRIVCPQGMAPGPYGRRCFPVARAPIHRGIVCPPGMAPGPYGRRCFPVGGPRFHRGIVCPPGMAPGPFGRRCFPIGR